MITSVVMILIGVGSIVAAFSATTMSYGLLNRHGPLYRPTWVARASIFVIGAISLCGGISRLL
jgi:hypothetical protein